MFEKIFLKMPEEKRNFWEKFFIWTFLALWLATFVSLAFAGKKFIAVLAVFMTIVCCIAIIIVEINVYCLIKTENEIAGEGRSGRKQNRRRKKCKK